MRHPWMLAVVGALAFASPAEAATPEVRTSYRYLSGTNLFTWFIRNSATDHSPLGLLGGWISIFDPARTITSGDPDVAYGTRGQVQEVGSSAGLSVGDIVYWGSEDVPYPNSVGIQIEANSAVFRQGIYGCAGPAPGAVDEVGQPVSWYYRTCAQDGFPGSVFVQLSYAGPRAQDGDVLFELDGTALPNASTIPEPASMALLGTGLAGLVGAARRRRRREGTAGYRARLRARNGPASIPFRGRPAPRRAGRPRR